MRARLTLPLGKAGAPAANPCFTIAQNDAGDWIARRCDGSVACVFPTQKEAIHFVLFARGDQRAAALLLPRVAERTRGPHDR